MTATDHFTCGFVLAEDDDGPIVCGAYESMHGEELGKVFGHAFQPDVTAPRPLFMGRTPLELEQMDHDELSTHLDRLLRYREVVEVELLVTYIIFKERRPFENYPRGATQRYQKAWKIATRRVGRKLGEILAILSG